MLSIVPLLFLYFSSYPFPLCRGGERGRSSLATASQLGFDGNGLPTIRFKSSFVEAHSCRPLPRQAEKWRLIVLAL